MLVFILFSVTLLTLNAFLHHMTTFWDRKFFFVELMYNNNIMKGIGSIYGIRYINKDNLKGGIQRFLRMENVQSFF